MRRLFPHPADAAGTVTVRDAYDVPRPAPPGRPWLSLCMVASLDGTTVVDGRSRALSSPADQGVLLTMRSLVDAVIVGAGTVRDEGYGVPRHAQLKVVVVSRSGAGMDFDAPLWQSGRAWLALPADSPEVPVPTLRAGTGTVDLAAVLTQASDRLGAGVMQAEGGPSLNGALLAADLVDELNLTVAPLLAGGDGPRLTTGAPAGLHRMELAHVLEDDGFLFTRYVRRAEPAG